MEGNYILGIDQSTQGTKALLFDENGNIIGRSDLPHDQIINELGWVEHDPVQIYNNTLSVVKLVIEKTKIDPWAIVGVGITNQRETAVVWDKKTGIPVYNAIVWQCARGASICSGLENYSDYIKGSTGLSLSPYFSAAKIAWILQNVEGAKEKSDSGRLACGTMDSWLVYQLTGMTSFKTDYSNASRTQLFNIKELTWDEKICDLFGINSKCLAKVCDTNSCFGETDFNGYLKKPIPIHCVIGDSHGALYGQNCVQQGAIKATYGTGSSVMMNIGTEPIFSKKGIVTSLAWGLNGKVDYVLEGNINYSGAVISWLKNDLQLVQDASETEKLAYMANPADKTYLVPAFSGLGAPYWSSQAAASLSGMTRTTGKAEIVKAALESIAYQIADIMNAMSEETGIPIKCLRVDGGPTKNSFLMQFQSNIVDTAVLVPVIEELSVYGAVMVAGRAMGIYPENQLQEDKNIHRYLPEMGKDERGRRYQGWKEAVGKVLA